MSPTNLGDLSNILPIPNGAVQVKRGITDTYPQWANAQAGVIMTDGSGGPMQISVTPSMPCYWLVTACTAWAGVVAAWNRADFGIRLSPADIDGRNIQARTATATHSSVPWRTYSGSMMWRLAAGVTYTAGLYFEYATATVMFSTHPQWHTLYGILLAEGVA